MNKKRLVKSLILLTLSSLIQAFALVNFYQSSGLLSSGLTGVALIVNKLSSGAIPLGGALLVMNIPLAILAYFNVGKYFTVLSFINVVITSIFLGIMPSVVHLDDIMLNAIVGGICAGIGTGVALEAGASTGGTDFVALYMSVKKQVSAGKYMMILNGLIVLASAYFFNITIAVYTLISVFVSSKVIDAIHVRYNRVTLAIITGEGDKVIQTMLDNTIHGMTVLPAKGGYTKEDKNFIYTVVSTYEINLIRDMIFDIDPHAFINVTPSKEILGNFQPSKYD
ncbi:YitT family protein [Mycoplasma sp. P36-A1]|uniref:YitT family protein n=1 Tax=Mycoplasma sp. P36-A1 TaxID=3252900 RepID=UPI003C2B9A2D